MKDLLIELRKVGEGPIMKVGQIATILILCFSANVHAEGYGGRMKTRSTSDIGNVRIKFYAWVQERLKNG